MQSVKRIHNSFVITDAYKSLRKPLPALFFEANVPEEFGVGLTSAFELDTTAQRRDESSAQISKPAEPDNIGQIEQKIETIVDGASIKFADAVKMPISVKHILQEPQDHKNFERSIEIRQFDKIISQDIELERRRDILTRQLIDMHNKFIEYRDKIMQEGETNIDTENQPERFDWLSNSRDVVKLKLNFFILYVVVNQTMDSSMQNLLRISDSDVELICDTFKNVAMDYFDDFFASKVEDKSLKTQVNLIGLLIHQIMLLVRRQNNHNNNNNNNNQNGIQTM